MSSTPDPSDEWSYGSGPYDSGPHHGAESGFGPYGGAFDKQGFPQNMPPAPPSGGPHPPPQPGMPPMGTPVYGYLAPYRPTHPLATASLILSLAGLACVLPAIAGVITGHMARKRIRAEPQYDGWGMALVGVILGWIITGGLLLYVGAVIVAIILATVGSMASS